MPNGEKCNMPIQILNWISEIVAQRQDVLGLAVSQRAKFEGWLKFEMACKAEFARMDNVQLEEGYGAEEGKCRADISFSCEGVRYFVELKTSNTSLRMDGVDIKTKPTSKNIKSIIKDANKFRLQNGVGIIAFVLFPIKGDYAAKYLEQIQFGLGMAHSLCEEPYSRPITISVDNVKVDMIACAFSVSQTH